MPPSNSVVERGRTSIRVGPRGPAIKTSVLAIITIAAVTAVAVVFGRGPAIGAGVLLAILVVVRIRGDAASPVIVFTILILLIPARLRIAPLASLGTPASLIGLSAFGLWVYGRIFSRSSSVGARQPLLWAFAILSAVVLASNIALAFRAHDIIESKAADRGILLLLSMVGIAMLAADTLRTREQIRRVLQAIAACGTIVSGLGIVQFITGFDLGSMVRLPGFTYIPSDYNSVRSGFNRIVSTTSHPIELSVVLALALCAAMYLWLTSHPSARRQWIVASVIIGISIPLTVSRTSVIAIVAVLVVLAPIMDRIRRQKLVLVVLLAIVGLRIAVPGLTGTLRSLFLLNSSTDPSLQSRTIGFERAVAMIGERPLLGRGFGTFVPEKYFYLDDQMVLTLVETGVLGLLAVWYLFATAGWMTRSIRRLSTRFDDRCLSQCLLAAVAVGFLTAFTFDSFSFASSRTLLMLLIGLAGALWRIVWMESNAKPAVTKSHREGTHTHHRSELASTT